MLHLSRDVARWDPAGAVAARVHFETHHWIKLEGLISGPLLAQIQHAIGTARFSEVVHRGVSPPSVDVCMDPNPTSALLELLCNDPTVLAAVEAITGCSPLTRFSGFVYRLSPVSGHHHNWHNDLIQERRVAMSVNLEPKPYDGGVLQIRVRETEAIIAQVHNVGAGDAVLFRISAALQHRATPVTAGVKTAFAGWFRSAPSLREELASLATSDVS